MSNIELIRSANFKTLYRAYSVIYSESVSEVIKIQEKFATQSQISSKMVSDLLSFRPPTSKISRQIEKLCSIDTGWLDVDRLPKSEEDIFIEKARSAWLSKNPEERKELESLFYIASKISKKIF